LVEQNREEGPEDTDLIIIDDQCQILTLDGATCVIFQMYRKLLGLQFVKLIYACLMSIYKQYLIFFTSCLINELEIFLFSFYTIALQK
jgi:hypothetical protein